MSQKYPGGIITKNPTPPTGPYETSAAPGVWTLSQVSNYVKQGIWPTAGRIAPDAQFNYVTMLLHGDGTNGAQNNTFLDSSTNNFTITRNGNTTQGSFSPYGSNWSNYFNGSTDYLTMPDNANYVISGDFTMEAWIYPATFASTNGNIVLSQWPGAVATNCAFQFQVNSTGKVSLTYGIGGTNAIVAGTSLSCTLNTWNHIAITRSGTTVRYFVNGSVDSTTSTVSGSFNDSTGVMTVGRANASDLGYFSGYISNCRLVIGTALYTAAFTPSTTPLTAVSGTQVLVCQSNRFLDTSSNNATITVGGSPSVQRFNPFGASTAYSTSVIGGSGYFDGTGDYLSVADNAALELGSGNWTIECFVNTSNTTAYSAVISRDDGGVTAGSYVILLNGATANGFVAFYSADINGFGAAVLQGNIKCNDSAWHHIAVVRNSNTLTLYIDGVSNATATYSGAFANTAQPILIGTETGYARAYTGYISNVRYVIGTAVYTSNFTPPTAPLTAITNTQLLLSCTNGAIYDNAMMNNLETVGNAQISTSVVKYGTGSLSFGGTGSDYLVGPNTTNMAFGTGDYTLEAWVYPNSVTYNTIVSTGTGGAFFGFYFGALAYYEPTAGLVATTTTISTGTWTHVAFCRSGTSLRLFINGVLSKTSTVSTNLTGTACLVGFDTAYSGPNYSGYMDDLRITKGYARYTATFTPPTAAFPNTGPN